MRDKLTLEQELEITFALRLLGIVIDILEKIPGKEADTMLLGLRDIMRKVTEQNAQR